MVSTALGVVRKLSPGMREDVQGDRPYVLSFLAATAQALRCDASGEAPDVMQPVMERTVLLGDHFRSAAVTSRDRKKYFSRPESAVRAAVLEHACNTHAHTHAHANTL